MKKRDREEEERRDLETRRRAAAEPLFLGCFPVGYVPTWHELADQAERLRLEGATRLSAETLLGQAARDARLERRLAARRKAREQ